MPSLEAKGEEKVDLEASAPGESRRQAVESIRKVATGEMGLLDGGATACTRTAKDHERNLSYPTVKASLALGESRLMISPEGTLLSVERASPIVSYTALHKLGYRIICDEDIVEVVHQEDCPLDIDMSTGCPEVPREVAEELIERREALVRHCKVEQARVAAISQDLAKSTDSELIQNPQQGKCETEAAMRVFAKRLFPQAPDQLIEAVVSCLPTDGKSWNRHKCRRAKREAFVHLFAAESREAFKLSAQGRRLKHIPVDIKEDLCSAETHGFLLTLALSAALRVLIGGPPRRTYTVCRHIPAGPNTPRPVRSREGRGRYGLDGLSCLRPVSYSTFPSQRLAWSSPTTRSPIFGPLQRTLVLTLFT